MTDRQRHASTHDALAEFAVALKLLCFVAAIVWLASLAVMRLSDRPLRATT